MTKKKNDGLVAVATMLVLIGAIVGGALWYRSCQGGVMGTPCTEGNLGCKPGFFCALDVCTAKCTSNADCLEGWRCGEIEETSIIGPDIETGKQTIQACIPPRR